MTVTVPLSVHPAADVPITVYVVVAVGEAVTELPVVPLNPDEGDQVYVLPPVAVKVVLVCPIQIEEVEALMFTVGTVLAFTTIVERFVQPVPELVPVTVYVVFDVGLAVTLEPVVPLSPVEGVQVYVFAPDPVKVTVDWPTQTPLELLLVIPTDGAALTVTCISSKTPVRFPQFTVQRNVYVPPVSPVTVEL